MSQPTSVPAPTHGCVRCGRAIPLDDAMCEFCNPLGLRQPAASQAHGTVFLGIGLAVVGLAVFARVLTASVGPFRGEITGVAAADAGLRVSIVVTNEGTQASTTTCRVSDPAIGGIGPEAAIVHTPSVEAGGSRAFEVVVVSLGTEPRPLALTCDR